MPTDVIMPQMGESIFEGTITKWFKQAGDRVEKDEALFEISTDKVDAEIPSPVAGVLVEIRVPEGATVQVNTVVAVVAESGRPAEPSHPAVPSAPNPQTVAAQPLLPAGPAACGVEVVMPQMGESIFEGTIAKWLKQPGDQVEKDEPLFEISTDKVDAEIPSPVTGVLAEIKFPEGATVQINTVVAVIGGAVTVAASSVLDASAFAPHEATRAEAVAQKAEAAQPAGRTRRIRSSPLVRRMAQENRVDLARIAGTGWEGRISKDDLLRYLRERGSGNASIASAGLCGAVAPSAPQPPAESMAPLTKMRAIIAQRMVESVSISPHAHNVYKVDMTRIAHLREREKAGFEQRHQVKLTYMPFIAAAAIKALASFPIVNASLENGFIHYHAHINLGIAVALEWGLIVPVVKQAEERGFPELARAMADLAARARAKKLIPDEVAGSTFTLTNSGIFGDEFGMPIINQPESAILAIGGLRKEPVVLTDAEGNDSIAIRSMQHFCLGFDHRTIDGADAGKFMAEFKRTLENWDRQIG